jgi:hypothetical protein
LEIDLISSVKARSEYFKWLKVPPSEQTSKNLLENRKKEIKKIENILNVVKNTPHRNLPNSYKRIKKVSRKLL